MKSLDGYKNIDFDNKYFVDEDGNVYSNKSNNLKKLNGFIHKDGYRQYNLGSISPLGHRLVTWAFLGECPAGKEVGHYDGNGLNNNLKNLRYVTPKENQLDKVRHGTQLYGSYMPQAKLKESDILNIYKMLDNGYTHRQIAEKYNISRGYVAHIKSGNKWSYLKVQQQQQ